MWLESPGSRFCGELLFLDFRLEIIWYATISWGLLVSPSRCSLLYLVPHTHNRATSSIIFRALASRSQWHEMVVPTAGMQWCPRACLSGVQTITRLVAEIMWVTAHDRPRNASICFSFPSPPNHWSHVYVRDGSALLIGGGRPTRANIGWQGWYYLLRI